MFGDCHTEDEKVKMVDDLLDVKLLPATNVEGVHFNADRLKERYIQIIWNIVVKKVEILHWNNTHLYNTISIIIRITL